MIAYGKIGFLARFAGLLFLAVVGMSVALSFLFARAHLEALRSDLILNASGQASATLQPALEKYAKSGKFTEADRAGVDAAVRDVQNFQSLVRTVRLYRPDGTPLDPVLAPEATEYVKRAIAEQNIVEAPSQTVEGETVIPVYVPLASATSSGYLAVAAIDVSTGQLDVQTGSETQFVVTATVVGCALIFLSLITLAIAAQRELNVRRKEADTTFLQTMEGLAAIVDQRDPYTAGHSRRVSEYSVLIAKHLNVSAKEIERVRWSALLHDLGKIGIPDAVLLKNGPLDPHERAIISQHPTIAKEILGPVAAMAQIVPCVLHHHERWDGRGYPAGLAGEQIPLLSRVIAVADTFDAMTTDRPYRKGLTIDEARTRLREGAGAQWDARCIDAAIALIDANVLKKPESVSAEFGPRAGLHATAAHPA